MTEHIGIYRVEGPIGRGGMGEVLLAWDDRLERRVAIKRIRRDAGLSPEQRERFRREARLAARLSHSAVVQIYDLVSEGSDDAIVMEYVEGATLAERLAGGPLEIGRALRLAQEIAEGLAAAHAAGLIHRDLKAANVIVTLDGRAKILDFGLARPVARPSDETPLTRQGFVIGTLQSMSPEQARGQDLDARSDLFSFGVLLYEMLTGQAPFRGADPLDTLRRVVYEEPREAQELRPDLPVEVEVLLERLLAKDREDRPGSAQEVAAALERLRTGSGSRPLIASAAASVSDLPTAQIGPAFQSKPLTTPLSPQTGPPPSSLVGAIGRSQRRGWLTLTAAMLIGAVTAIAFLKWPSAAPLRVAVAPVKVEAAGDQQLTLAASAVLTAVASGLTSLEGLAAIDSGEAGLGALAPRAMAQAAAAEEVLTSEVRREGQLARVKLSRLQGTDGRVLWTTTFQVLMGTGDLQGLADAVAVNVRKAYRDHDLLSGVPDLEARPEDYAAFLEIKQLVDAGAVPPEPALGRLEEVVRSSPRFLEAQILASRLALNLFRSRQETADLDRATALVQQAKDLAPNDPRPLRQELQIAFARNDLGKAKAILAELEKVRPGNPEHLTFKARLAERQGRMDEAARLQAAASEQVPSWQNLFWLATLEARRGHIDTARELIEKILAQDSGNLDAKEALGHIELLHGNPARAEEIYHDLVGSIPRRALNNLGLARFLLGHYEEAAEAYRRALARLEETEKTVRLGPEDTLRKAVCLARLGRLREAVELAQDQIRRTPDDAELLQQSALVHSIAGDRTSAINNALDALDKGLHPGFFRGSAFSWLRDLPEFRSRFATASLP